MQNAWIWIVVVVIILVGGFIWWQSSQTPAIDVNLTPGNTTVTPTPSPEPSATTSSTTSTDTSATGGQMTATVTYSANGYSPSTVTIKKGGTVTWNGPSNMWVASAPHPAHTGYDGTSRSTHCSPSYSGPKPFDECAGGSTYSFTFDKVGTWPYHDHMNASNFGTIVVTE